MYIYPSADLTAGLIYGLFVLLQLFDGAMLEKNKLGLAVSG